MTYDMFYRLQKILLSLAILTPTSNIFSVPITNDSIIVNQQDAHWGAELEFQAGTVMILDKYQKSYMKSKDDYSFGLKLTHASLPSDNDPYAYDYNYPTFSIVTKFSKNNGATMHRDVDFPHWSYLTDEYYEISPYKTHLGNSLALYGSFSYPLLRNKRWEIDISGNIGLAYSATKYDKEKSVDNDMIGSHLLFYAGGGISATYRLSNSYGLRAGLDYWHISDGSTRQPNRSANIIGPTIGFVYYPYYESLLDKTNIFCPSKFKPYWYMNIKGGVGMKTCFEDWERTQYNLKKDDPDWRTERFRLYSVASLQTDMMYRYSRIGSIGGGIDLQYASCYSHIRDIDNSKGYPINCGHSPWSFALDLKHTLFYKNISLALGLGVYLYREMGDYSNRKELFFFNRIGVHYTIPKWYNITFGVEVKAHLANADFSELIVSWPIKL